MSETTQLAFLARSLKNVYVEEKKVGTMQALSRSVIQTVAPILPSRQTVTERATTFVKNNPLLVASVPAYALAGPAVVAGTLGVYTASRIWSPIKNLYSWARGSSQPTISTKLIPTFQKLTQTTRRFVDAEKQLAALTQLKNDAKQPQAWVKERTQLETMGTTVDALLQETTKLQEELTQIGRENLLLAQVQRDLNGDTEKETPGLIKESQTLIDNLKELTWKRQLLQQEMLKDVAVVGEEEETEEEELGGDVSTFKFTNSEEFNLMEWEEKEVMALAHIMNIEYKDLEQTKVDIVRRTNQPITQTNIDTFQALSRPQKSALVNRMGNVKFGRKTNAVLFQKFKELVGAQ